MKGMTQVIRMTARFSIVPIEAERYRISFHVILFLLYYPSPLPLPKAGTDSPLCRLYFSHKIKDFAGALFYFTSSGQMN